MRREKRESETKESRERGKGGEVAPQRFLKVGGYNCRLNEG